MPLTDKLLGHFSYRSLWTQIHQLQADKHHVHEGEGRLPSGLWGGQWFLDLLSQLPWQPVCAAGKHHLCTAYGQNREDKDDRWVWMWWVSDGSVALQGARALCCCTWRQAELAQVEMNHAHVKWSRRVKKTGGWGTRQWLTTIQFYSSSCQWSTLWQWASYLLLTFPSIFTVDWQRLPFLLVLLVWL